MNTMQSARALPDKPETNRDLAAVYRSCKDLIGRTEAQAELVANQIENHPINLNVFASLQTLAGLRFTQLEKADIVVIEFILKYGAARTREIFREARDPENAGPRIYRDAASLALMHGPQYRNR